MAHQDSSAEGRSDATAAQKRTYNRDDIWSEISAFQEKIATTTGSLHPVAQEEDLIKSFLGKVPLMMIFECLEDMSSEGDQKKVNVICKCLNRILSSDRSDGLFFDSTMLPVILAGLKHRESRAKSLTLSQLSCQLKKKPCVDRLDVLAEPTILEELCNVVSDEDAAVASKAMDLLVESCSFPEKNLYKLILPGLTAKATSKDVEANSVEQMRFFETIARICEQSEEHTAFAVETNAVDVILDTLRSDDPLFLLNVVALLPRICQTRSGIHHIFHSGVLQRLHSLSDDPFVGGNVLRLLGELSVRAAELHVESWNWTDPTLSKAFFTTVEAKLESKDELEQIAAMDTIASFGSSSDKELYLLLQHKALCHQWLSLATSTKMPLKTNCFHAVATILARPTGVLTSDAAVWQLNQQLFASLGAETRRPTTVAYLMECLRQPFEEIRIGIYQLLRAVAAQNHEWGMAALLAYGGFLEFLMDRTTEPNKQTREWKFAIVDAVLSSPFKSKIDAATLAKLQDHLAKGPYVGKPPLEMEMEAV